MFRKHRNYFPSQDSLFLFLFLSLFPTLLLLLLLSFFSVSTQPYGFNNKLFYQRTSILQTMTMNQTHTRQQNCFKKSNLKQKLKYPIPKKTQIMLKLKKNQISIQSDLNREREVGRFFVIN